MAVRRGDGAVLHAELGRGASRVMLGTPIGDDGPPVVPPAAQRPRASVMCHVDEVDAHHRRARAASAEIVTPRADQSYGSSTYEARDPEDHAWFFATRREGA